MAVPAQDLQALALSAAWVAAGSLAFAGNRTLLHVAVGSVAWLALLYAQPWVALAGGLVLVALAAAAHRLRPRAYAQVMPQADAGPVAFFAGIALVLAAWTLLGFDARWAVVALLPMAWADPVGFYAGRRLGAHRLPNGKTWEGFAAVLLVALVAVLAPLLALWPPGARPWLAGVLAALGAALAEVVAPAHLDNLLMPLGSLAGLAAAGVL